MGIVNAEGSMRYLLISDIHSNLEALEATLEFAEKLAPYQLMCLGDIVGYGADPASCIDTVGNQANLILAGNHDLAVADVISVEDFNPIAREAVEWTQPGNCLTSLRCLRHTPFCGNVADLT